MTNITGASFLANHFRTLIADTKAQLAKAGDDMSVAMAELAQTADHAIKQVKIVQTETADLKAALGLHTNGGEPLDEIVPMHVTPIPPAVSPVIPMALPRSATSGEFETPPPFYGPGHPPSPPDDQGDVKTIQLVNGEIGTI